MSEARQHLPYHWLLYGDSGSGKSTGIATWPKPMIVFAFDPFGKETPYLKKGTPTGLSQDSLGTPFREVVSKKGELLIRLEYFIDAEPELPIAYPRFLKRIRDFQSEYGQWATAVVDSITFMELAARKWHQYGLNPTAREPRQWFSGSTDLLEEMLMIRFGSLPMNVCIAAHVDEDKDEAMGTFVRNPKAPGRMRKSLGAGYSELYRAYAVRGERGDLEYWWQTKPDKQYSASSQIGAPDPCPPVYSAIWQPNE